MLKIIIKAIALFVGLPLFLFGFIPILIDEIIDRIRNRRD